MAAPKTYSDDVLREAIANAKTWRAVCMALGYSKHPGGAALNRIRARATAAEVAFSHLERSEYVIPAEKACPLCDETKPMAEFGVQAKSRDGRQWCCRPCKRAKIRQHYRDNLDYYAEKAAKNRAKDIKRNRDWVTSFLRDHPCVDCGESDMRCLQFDHVKGVKVGNVSDMIRRPSPLVALQAEVAKCVVRCANCHMKKTAVDQAWWSAIAS